MQKHQQLQITLGNVDTVGIKNAVSDVTLTLTHATGSTSDSVTVSLTGENAFDLTLIDANAATNDIDNLTLAVAGAANHTVDLSNDFDATLTVNGGATGELTILNSVAATINTSAHAGRTWVDVNNTATVTAHNVTTGAANDAVDFTGDTFATTDTLNMGAGTDVLMVAILW